MGVCVSEFWEWPLCPMQVSFWSDVNFNPNVRLPAFGSPMSTSTVSGFSLGGAAAEALAVIYSKDIAGVGAFAGGTFGGYIDYWALQDRYPYTADEAYERAVRFANEGTIDPLSNMVNKPVWLHWGTNDKWKAIRGDEDQTLMGSTKFNADLTFKSRTTGHVIPVTAANGDGTVTDNYDGFGNLLQDLWTKLSLGTLTASSTSYQSLGTLREFDQREFVDAYIPWEWHGLSTRGFVYYPDACKTAGSGCQVHMYLHGCSGNSFTKLDFKDNILGFENIGLLQYASTNNIVVIIPQAKIDAFPNLGECWDGKGMYHWDLTYTKISPQYKALKRMIDRVVAPHGSINTDYSANNIYTMSQEEYATQKAWWYFFEAPQIWLFDFNRQYLK